MNKYQEALDELRLLGLSIPAIGQGEEMGFSEDFNFDHNGYEDECELLQELIDILIPPKDVDEAIKFYLEGLYRNLYELATIQETIGYQELGSKHYRTSKDVMSEYLADYCNDTIVEVVNDWIGEE